MCNIEPPILVEAAAVMTMPKFDILRHEPDQLSFAKGAVIFKEGEPGDCMFFVIEGTVSVQIGGADVTRLESGEIFGEMALIDHAPRSATAVAATDCRLAAINEQRFLRLVVQVPMFALNLMQVITHRLRRSHPG
jgi:CRP-like cAMP-binding protein